MKKLFVYPIVLFLLILVISTDSLADRKPHHRHKVVVIKPVRPHVRVIRPLHLRPGVVWVDGHYKWNKRTHKHIWVKGHITKKKKGLIRLIGH